MNLLDQRLNFFQKKFSRKGSNGGLESQADSNRVFLEKAYREILGREIDASG